MKKIICGVLVFLFLFSLIGIAFSSDPKIQYIASIRSNRYHYPWCKAAKRIKPEYLIVFDSAKEAQKNKYIPCKICKPPTK